jgi:AraC-like DNA-binding protein
MIALHDQASGPLALPAESRAADDGVAFAPFGADVLSDVLEAVRLTGSLFFIVDASLPWVAEAPDAAALAPVILPRAQHVVSYHVILEGACWCGMAGLRPVRLEAGDVLVVPHGDAYALSSAPDVGSGATVDEMLAWFRRMAAGELPVVVTEGGGGAGTVRIVCGFLGCDALPFNPVLATLPRILRIRPPCDRGADRLHDLAALATAEAREQTLGSRSVLLRIGELMFVEALRRYLAGPTMHESGWLAGLRDPLVGRVLSHLHREPHRAWTLEALAREVAASRSVLAERFTHFVGQPPMHYLMRWRMQLAAARLSDHAAKISAVAQEVGYESEAAFSRAFKRLTGVPPALWRETHSAAGAADRLRFPISGNSGERTNA